MIEMTRVSKRYGSSDGPPIIDDLSALFDGTTDVGILGGNGSGKSTLIRMMAGMEMPDSGRVVRKGRVSFPLGFNGGFHPLLSARENIRFVSRVYGCDVQAVIRFCRDFAEIGAQFDKPISTYSNSMKARVTFALAMAIDFDLYLVDEVTAVGDASFKRKCMAAFAERRRNARVIMVSQATTTIRKICQHGAVLENGRLKFFQTMGEAINAYETSLGMLNV